MDINALVNTFVEDKYICKEDREIAKMCLLLIKHGWKDKNKIKEQVNIEDFEKYWENLEKNGYFLENGKVNINMVYNESGFLIMMLVAKGFVKWG